MRWVRRVSGFFCVCCQNIYGTWGGDRGLSHYDCQAFWSQLLISLVWRCSAGAPYSAAHCNTLQHALQHALQHTATHAVTYTQLPCFLDSLRSLFVQGVGICIFWHPMYPSHHIIVYSDTLCTHLIISLYMIQWNGYGCKNIYCIFWHPLYPSHHIMYDIMKWVCMVSEYVYDTMKWVWV